ncbi:CU044_5270 family protein [Streptomyces sp. NPDC056708]|uniref:CU044_5270 family protein n=1 Tax=unclassified Streptomyces TaxID=2593676 RepID=UPI0036BC001A
MREIDERFRSLNEVQSSDKQPDKAVLQQILSTPRAGDVQRRHSPFRSRRWVLLSAAAATAVALGLVATNMFGTAPQPAYAVTPTPLKYQSSSRPTAEVLEGVARRTEELPDDPPASTPERFVQESWSLSTRIDGIQVTSAVVPERRETLKYKDGSEKWTVRTQRPRFQSQDQRRIWENSGSVGKDSDEYSGSSGPADMSDGRNREAPETPEGMRRWLSLGYETSGGGEMFDSVSERSLDRSFTPKQRAALLRTLKEVEGIVYRGQAKDRSGRTGEAFSVQSMYGGLPTKHTLLFDSSTGQLLSYEEELTGSPGALKVKTPAVVLYVTYLDR